MGSPFFSIIIPTFNRAKVINSTIKSVLKQSFSNFEIIIIDDGSTDDTKEVIKKIKDNRVKYIYQKNSERSVARNKGIINAAGEWICFLDSDDEYESDHLQNFFEEISKDSNPKLYFSEQKVKEVDCGSIIIQKTKYNKCNAPLFFAQESVVPGRVCIHREILKKHKFDEEIVIVEDADLWFRISCYFQVKYINKSSFIYNLHEDNSINVKNNAYLKRLKGLKKTFNKKEKKYLKKEDRSMILNNCYFGIHKYYVKKNQILKSRLSILRAIILYPKHRLKEKLYLFLYPKNI